MNKGLEVYKQLKEDNKNHKYFDENEFNRMGYRFLNTGDISGAIEVFKMAVELFPELFNTWDSLGEAYMKKGNRSLAIKNYEKSLELNPENNNAKEMLKKLEEE